MPRLLFLLLALAPLHAQSPEDEIRALVGRYVAAREALSEAQVTTLFTPDADQLVSSGEWRRGRPALVKGALASSRSNEGRRTVTLESIRLLTPDTALADGRYEIAGAADTRRMWSTFVLQRTPDGWRIAAIRNMLPAPR